MRFIHFSRVFGLLAVSACLAQESFPGSVAIDAAIERAIAADQLPGAVVVVGHGGRVLHRKAYGSRVLVPANEAMTLDTIFDAASLTKVIATTSCILKLVEEGKVRLGDLVTVYLPEYQGGKSDITVRQLLTHYSGLRPDLDLKPAWSGYETGIGKALIDRPVSLPGSRFIYSDINFLLLGEIVRRIGGKPLPEYARDQIFAPLGMSETMFQPPPSLQPRIAPTENVDGAAPLRGVVHDPTTRFMEGIAGHAGLFTTATDLAKFAEMMLGEGRARNTRIFGPLTVRAATSPQSPLGMPPRGFGWDIDSPFAGSRGDLFGSTSYGHTGFTGTSLWIDPASQTYVILLSNSGHPHLRTPVTSLRGRIANIVAANLDVGPITAAPASAPRLAPSSPAPSIGVLTGLDVLASARFEQLKGKRVGLITNHTGTDRDGRRNIDVMVQAGVKLTAVFSPEHGITGKEDHENVANATDAATGIPIWSLYSGPSRRPKPELLRNLDVLVFDIQDIGTRFYTYTCTMANAMQEAAKAGLPFMVLDRPNPVTGTRVEGPLLDPEIRSFVGCYSIPLRHGMTMGELARMFNHDQEPKAALEVIAMKNWSRSDWFDFTGLIWVDPSPNMRSLNAALLYPGIGMLEYSKNYSVGRGTDAPFEQVGADWIRGRDLAAELNRRKVPGVRVYATSFTPTSSYFVGKRIEGVRFIITDRETFDSVQFGLEVATALSRLYPGKLAFTVNEKLVGSRSVVKALESAEDPELIRNRLSAPLNDFNRKRSAFLLY